MELGPATALRYLEAHGWDTRGTSLVELGGGVSNTVLLVEMPRQRIVLKQALGKLRVEQDWFSDRSRALREARAMAALAPLLPSGAVPEVLFVDEDNWIFAMKAAPPDSANWKSQLLAGVHRRRTAESIGNILGALVRQTWHSPDWEKLFGDQTVFDQLRLDPYYRSTAERHPELEPQFARAIEHAQNRRVSLAHGDWSPKNFLIFDEAVMAIDFEVIHYGDPAFDAAFLLNHLLLKSYYRPRWRAAFEDLARTFWDSYCANLPEEAKGWIGRATAEHLGCLLLARVDGKSPAEYITEPGLRQTIRERAREWIAHPAGSPLEAWNTQARP